MQSSQVQFIPTSMLLQALSEVTPGYPCSGVALEHSLVWTNSLKQPPARPMQNQTIDLRSLIERMKFFNASINKILISLKAKGSR